MRTMHERPLWSAKACIKRRPTSKLRGQYSASSGLIVNWCMLVSVQTAAQVAQHELAHTQAELRSATSSPRKPVNARGAPASAAASPAQSRGLGSADQGQEDARQAANDLLAAKLTRLESDWRYASAACLLKV